MENSSDQHGQGEIQVRSRNTPSAITRVMSPRQNEGLLVGLQAICQGCAYSVYEPVMCTHGRAYGHAVCSSWGALKAIRFAATDNSGDPAVRSVPGRCEARAVDEVFVRLDRHMEAACYRTIGSLSHRGSRTWWPSSNTDGSSPCFIVKGVIQGAATSSNSPSVLKTSHRRKLCYDSAQVQRILLAGTWTIVWLATQPTVATRPTSIVEIVKGTSVVPSTELDLNGH